MSQTEELTGHECADNALHHVRNCPRTAGALLVTVCVPPDEEVMCTALSMHAKLVAIAHRAGGTITRERDVYQWRLPAHIVVQNWETVVTAICSLLYFDSQAGFSYKEAALRKNV